jgi:hypothetical protein
VVDPVCDALHEKAIDDESALAAAIPASDEEATGRAAVIPALQTSRPESAHTNTTSCTTRAPWKLPVVIATPAPPEAGSADTTVSLEPQTT